MQKVVACWHSDWLKIYRPPAGPLLEEELGPGNADTTSNPQPHLMRLSMRGRTESESMPTLPAERAHSVSAPVTPLSRPAASEFSMQAPGHGISEMQDLEAAGLADSDFTFVPHPAAAGSSPSGSVGDAGFQAEQTSAADG